MRFMQTIQVQQVMASTLRGLPPIISEETSIWLLVMYTNLTTLPR